MHTKQDILDYMTWTYFFRRLLKNPSYYSLESLETEDVNYYLSILVQSALDVLVNANCVEVEEVSFSFRGVTMSGRLLVNETKYSRKTNCKKMSFIPPLYVLFRAGSKYFLK